MSAGSAGNVKDVRPVRAAARTARSAFTLIELLLVLVILAILTTVVVVNFANRPDQARKTAAAHTIHELETVIDAFHADTGRYPTSDEGLSALITQPGNVRNWSGPYLKGSGVPQDPWGNPYIYRYPGSHNANGYDLLSAGPDGHEGTEDDIDNWSPQK